MYFTTAVDVFAKLDKHIAGFSLDTSLYNLPVGGDQVPCVKYSFLPHKSNL